MRIGELSRQTGVPVRLLRYYEEQGLLGPDRSANGYRAYAPSDIQRVTQIRGLIDAGVPTAIIRDILPCLDDPCTIVLSDPAPAVIAALEQHRQMIDARIACLSRNRDAISRYLKAIDAQLADCGMNLSLIGGLLDGLRLPDWQPLLDPRPGHCCVAVEAHPPTTEEPTS